MGVLIRPFQPEDFPGIWLLELGEKGARYPASVFIRQASVLFPGTFLVAIADDIPAGYCIGAISQDKSYESWILRLRVSLPYRRLHIGSDLINALLAEFSIRRICLVHLSVAPWNAGALALYRKCGFENSAYHEGYFGDGEDRIIMTLRMNQGSVK
jgi:ribosomal protein S18 acetylase RimI-like enzyme